MTNSIVPISAVIATRNRTPSLLQTIDSLSSQGTLPAELIVVDTSLDDSTKNALAEFSGRIGSSMIVRWFDSDEAGAAPQRNQGMMHVSQPFVWFLDDDVRFEPECVVRL